MWDAICNLLKTVLAAIEGFCGDWGLAIIILTIIIRLLLIPLMTRSTEASAHMQVLQPKLKEIQTKYADDPVRQRDEMQKLYTENKFNPLGGCLPILLQMPIFFALFTVTREVGEEAHFYGILPSLQRSASGAFSEWGIAGGWVYVLLVVVFGVLTLIPMLMNLKNMEGEQRSQSLIMGVMMAIMMLWVGWGLPSGVLLYYDTSALWQVVQQKLVTQRVMDRAKAEAQAKLDKQPVEVEVVRKEHKPRPKKKTKA